MGFAASPEAYPPEITALYPPEGRFSGQERVLYGLSVLAGLSYRDFYALWGDHAYDLIRSKDRYMAFLKKSLPLEDGAALQRRLERLLELGVLDQASYSGAMDLLLSRRLTDAVAFLLERGRRLGGRRRSGGGIFPLNVSLYDQALIFRKPEGRI